MLKIAPSLSLPVEAVTQMSKTAVKVKPILFSTALVPQILSGAKTVTRRVVKPQPQMTSDKDASWRDAKADLWRNAAQFARDCCPYGQPGDRLWVQESFYVDLLPYANGGSIAKLDGLDMAQALENIYYRADGECCQQIPECQCASVGKVRWRTSRFMPRWASRIKLEITGVRVERMQEISTADIRAERVYPFAPGEPNNPGYMEQFYAEARREFARTWDDLNGNREGCAWSDNPWVWRIEFKRVDL